MIFLDETLDESKQCDRGLRNSEEDPQIPGSLG